VTFYHDNLQGDIIIR